RIAVQPEIFLCKTVTIARPAQMNALRPHVGDFKSRVAKKLFLDRKIPLLQRGVPEAARSGNERGAVLQQGPARIEVSQGLVEVQEAIRLAHRWFGAALLAPPVGCDSCLPG